MPTPIRIDRQGRVVIPQRERERLGLPDGGTLELVSTAEGVLLERRREAAVTIGIDGLPVARIGELGEVTNDETIDAIHRHRDRA